MILGRGCPEANIESVLGLGADGVALSGEVNNAQLQQAAAKRGACCGRSIPDSVLLGAQPAPGDSFEEYISTRGRGSFITTEWDVPPDTDVSALHELMQVVRRV